MLAEEFCNPLQHDAIDTNAFDGLLIPGGHCARGMRPFLESATLQAKVAAFFDANKPVAAVCHGVLLAARSRSPVTGRSVLHGRKTTALPWNMESSAWSLTKFTASDPNYYRTYVEAPNEPAGFMSVQAEVTRALAAPTGFRVCSFAFVYIYERFIYILCSTRFSSRVEFLCDEWIVS